MGGYYGPSIALVTTETRLRGLLSKHGTKGAAKFKVSRQRHNYQESAGDLMLDDDLATFDKYVAEDERYNDAVQKVRHEIEDLGYPVSTVPKSLLPNYYFGATEAVVVVGPDGLVANTAKYATELPIIGVNPDPSQIDGVLLPFEVREVRRVMRKTLAGQHNANEVSLANVELPDGQTMYAFNDFFIGRRTHVSSRYVLYSGGRHESQSSSGVIIATGAGSTGWLSSVYNMTRAIVGATRSASADAVPLNHMPLNHMPLDHMPLDHMPWNSKQLRWVVREPFASRTSGTTLVTGVVDDRSPLRMESLMPEGGVIFSDGIEDDFLEFNSGTIAQFKIAKERSQLVSRT